LPDVPDETLLFNGILKKYHWQVKEHRPYTYCLFGGLRGELLPRLTGLAVSIVDFDIISGFEFLHNTELHGSQSYTLGVCEQYFTDELHEYQRMHFPIAGQDGERICAIDLQETNGGAVYALRVCLVPFLTG
jgi:hypothetical protein